jgi:hypothetical protein
LRYEVLRPVPEEKFRIWHVAPDGSEEFLDELGYDVQVLTMFLHTLSLRITIILI